MKTKSIRISEEQEQFLLSNYKNISQGISTCIDRMQTPELTQDEEILKHIRAYSTQELKGKFLREEWLFLIDSLNGTLTEGRWRCNADALSAHCIDAATLDHLDAKWEIDVQLLCGRIEALTGAQIEALYNYIEEFWNSEHRDLEGAATRLV